MPRNRILTGQQAQAPGGTARTLGRMGLPPRPPITVAIINDYELVVRGLAQMLADYPGRVDLVECDVRADVAKPVDVALYDTFAPARREEAELSDVIASPAVGKVIVYSWGGQPDRVDNAFALGADGFVSKATGALEMVEAIERVHGGEQVRRDHPVAPASADVDDPIGRIRQEPSPVEPPSRKRSWPGQAEGLTEREAEIIALITRGLSNKDIAARCFLSINSVKSYIRSAYRRMGVTSRSQAVLWGVRHGMAMEPPSRTTCA